MVETGSVFIIGDDNNITVVCEGMLDITNCCEFSDGIKQASLMAENLVIDLRGTLFIDTQVVQDLARAGMTMLERGKRLKVIVAEGNILCV